METRMGTCITKLCFDFRNPDFAFYCSFQMSGHLSVPDHFKEVSVIPIKLKMSRIIFALFCFIISVTMVGLVGAGINWALNLNVGSDGEFRRPVNKNADDWVNFAQLKTLGDEIIANHRRVRDLKEKLEANSYQDSVVKYTGMGVLILSTIVTILNRIQQVKRAARGEQAQSGFVMANQARANPDLFGRASF